MKKEIIPHITAIALTILGWAAAPSLQAQSKNDAIDACFHNRGLSAAATSAFQTTNPAVLGLVKLPRNQLIVPIFPAVEAGYWSNRLALIPYRNINMSDSGKLADYVNTLLDNSFNTGGSDPAEASKKIMKGVGDGVSICAQSRMIPFSLTAKLGAGSVNSCLDAQINVPNALFAAIFGDEAGLVPGNNLDFKGFTAEAVSYSTISAAYGRKFWTDSPERFICRLSRGFFDFTESSWGVGLDYVMGHALLKEKALDGSISVSNRHGTDVVAIDGRLEAVTAGGGIHGRWKTPQSMSMNNFFPGSGIGFNSGIAFCGYHTSLSLSLNNVGFIRWGHVKRAVYTLRDTSVRYSRLFSDSILEIKPGNGDSLNGAYPLYQSLPTVISLETNYTFHFDKKGKKHRAFSHYVTLSLRYDQHVAPWPTYSFIPNVSLDAENGALFGLVPVRCGFFIGGLGYNGSSLGFGVNTRYVKINLEYAAFGTPYFFPKRGCAISANMIGTWGYAL
jgi:hypothetical protein